MKRLALAVPLILLGSPAFSADAIVDVEPAPVLEATYGDWNGFYAGVQLGGAFGSTGIFTMDRNGDGVYGDYLPAFDSALGANRGFSGNFDDGFIGGVHVGYDWQMDRMVFGGILDISGTDINDRQSGFSSTPAFYHIDREIDWLATARLRAGYLFSDNILGYVTGGVAFADVNYRYVSNTPAVSVVSGGGDDVGYTVGAGAEMKVTSNVSIGLEYLYTNLGNNDFRVNLSGPAAFSGPGSAGSTNARGSDKDFDFHTVQFKVSYHF